MNDKITKQLFSEQEIKEMYERKDKFILDKDKNVIPANLTEWANFLNCKIKERRVGSDKINDYKISTIFLGLDHQWRENGPLQIFETMVFGKNMKDIYCDRYATWQEAEEGHKKAVKWVRDGCKDEY